MPAWAYFYLPRKSTLSICFMLQLFELEKYTLYHISRYVYTPCDHVREPYTEGYPSGLRGRFAKSLDWRDLVREFESPLLRQKETTKRLLGCFFSGERRRLSDRHLLPLTVRHSSTML